MDLHGLTWRLPLQIEHLHNIKCRELGSGVMTMPRHVMGVQSPTQSRQAQGRGYASEDSTCRVRSQTTCSGGCTSQSIAGSKNAEQGCGMVSRAHHASESDLATLGILRQSSLTHHTVMRSALYHSKDANQAANASGSGDQHGNEISVTGEI